MSKCKNYKTKIVDELNFKITGEPYYTQKEIGVCNLQHNCKECYCHGNKTRCDFEENGGKWR